MRFQELQNVLALEFGPDTAAKVTTAIRFHAGGETLYVPAKEPHPVVSPFDTPASLIRRGVKRRTAYRLLAKRR